MKSYRLTFILLMAISLITIASATAQTATEETRLSLDECRKLALQNNAQLKNAELDITAAQETKKAVHTKYFPDVQFAAGAFVLSKPLINTTIKGDNGINVDFTDPGIRPVLDQLLSMIGGSTEDFDMSVSGLDRGILGGILAMQPVFVGGRIVNGNKLAQLGVTAAQLQAALKINEINLRTEELYWTIISLQEKTKILDEVNLLLDTLYRDASAAVEVGVIHKNDLLRIRLKQSEVQSQELQLNNGITLAKDALCQHIGITGGITLTDTLGEVPLPQQCNSNVEAVQNRKEHALLDLSVEAERLKRKMLIGEALPQLAVGGGVIGNTLLRKFDAQGVLFATLSIPITAWWGKSHEMKQQKLNYQKAVNRRQDLDEQMQLQIQSAWNGLVESHAQLLIAQQTVDLAIESLKYSYDNYQAGMTSISDLLESQALLQQAQSQVADQKVAYLIRFGKYATLVNH